MKGKIIVFEGLDCSFKETNSKKLYEFLNNLGLKVHHDTFPKYSQESSYFVREYLKGTYKKANEVDPIIGSNFYMIDQYHTWKTVLEPLYNDGYTLILDRFWTSNLYHQVSKIKEVNHIELDVYKENLERTKRSIKKLAINQFKLPRPDLVLFMKLDMNNIIKLLKEKKSVNDIHENDLDYLKSVYKLYHSLEFPLNLPFETKSIHCSNINSTDYNNYKDGIEYDIYTKEKIFLNILEAVKETVQFN